MLRCCEGWMSLVSFRYSIFLFAGTILTLFVVAIIHRRTAAAARTRSHNDPQQQHSAAKKKSVKMFQSSSLTLLSCASMISSIFMLDTQQREKLSVCLLLLRYIFFAQARQRWTISNFSCSSSGFFAAKKEEAERGSLVLMELLRLYDLLQICHFLRVFLSLFCEVFSRRVFHAFPLCVIPLSCAVH